MLYALIKALVMSEDLKVRIELLKLEYSIIKDKLLLFSAGLGGSFTALFSLSLPLYIRVVAKLFFASQKPLKYEAKKVEISISQQLY